LTLNKGNSNIAPKPLNFNGERLGIDWNILRTMIDGKIRGIISGRKGAHCLNCNWDLEDYYPKQGPGKLFEVFTKQRMYTDHYISLLLF
jgi:hypothetical protein